MDFYNLLTSGRSLIANIEEKILLFGKYNGQSEEQLRINLSNHAKNVEKIIIGSIAGLSKG